MPTAPRPRPARQVQAAPSVRSARSAHSLRQAAASVFALLMLACALGALWAAPAWAQKEKKMVFYLNSYHNGYMWSDKILEGVRSVLDASPYQIELQIEYMDTKKYDYDEMEPRLLEMIKHKVAGEHYDVVIVADNNAFKFILAHGEELFPGVPVVFCGINDFDPKSLEGRHFTGVMENIDVRETLEVAVTLHPEARKLLVVGDDSITGKAIANQVREVEPDFKGRLEFEFLSNFDLEDALRSVTDLPKDTIAYFIPLYIYLDGNYYTSEELLQVFSTFANAPVYSNWEFLMGHGAVGGKMISGYWHGQSAAEKAVQVLDGVPTDQIPIQEHSRSEYMFDWKVLQKLHIDMSKLPEDSVFVNAPKAFYELDKELFWTIMVSLLILMMVSAMLARNVVRRRAVEREIKAQLSFLEILLDTIPLLICWKDTRQRYLGVNRSFVDFFSLGTSDCILNRLANEVPIDERFVREVGEMDRRVVAEKQPILRHKMTVKNGEGETFWLEINKVPLRDEAGNVVGTMSTADNITREVSLERQLLQSQKMEAIGTLAGGLAHDFNNILTSIINSTELVLGDLEDDSLAKRDLERVLGAAYRGSSVVKQILTFSRPTQEGFTSTVIAESVREALALMERSLPRNILIRQEITADDTVIAADPNQIHQVVMNLCTNSYQALRETGGEIEVSLEEVDLDDDFAQLLNLAPGPHLCLSVADNGPGIPHEIMDKVFDPFFTTKGKHEGTGLGLAVVHGIIKSHRGGVRLRSVPWVRTSMEIYLPVQPMAHDQLARTAAVPLPRGRERLLFVEDEEDQLATTPRILESMGYQVTACKDASSALQTLAATPHSFDLLITDFDMPGKNGLELAREVQRILPDLPVIIVSGREVFLEAASRAQNIADVVRKPYNKTKISEAIRQALS